MSIRNACLTVLLFTFSSFAPSALASSAQEARALLTAGDYVAARDIAQSLETAQGYALAAESLSAQILLADVDKINKRAKEAREFAMQALALDPTLYEARLQYALTDGFVTRSANPLTVWRKKLTQKTHANITSFRMAYPEDPRGMALEGAWHLAIIRKAGEKNSKKWFGASLEEGQRFYEEARQRAPRNIVIETNYALALYVLDSDAFGLQAEALLKTVSESAPRSDLERKVQEKASTILAAMHEPSRAQELAEDFLDGQYK